MDNMIGEQTDTSLSFYLRSNTVRVFTNALREIGEPKFIRFLINEERMEMVLQPYHKKDFQSFRVPKGLYQPDSTQSMRVHSQAFCRLLAMRLGWDCDESYRVPGTVIRTQRMIVFQLRHARQISS